MKRILAMVLCMGMLLCSCTPSGTSSKPKRLNTVSEVKPLSFDKWHDLRDENPVDDGTKSAFDSFSAKTAAKLLISDSENLCYSPFSLYYALSIAACGAQGDTAEELLSLLGFDDASSLSEQCGNVYRVLASHDIDGNAALTLASSLWLSEAEGFNDEFINTCAEQLYAEVYSASFASKKTAEEMSEWIKDKTHGTITPTFNVDAQQLMSIINTLYLKDEWVDRFDKSSTAEDIFTKADGSEVKCDFMNAVRQQSFMYGDNYTAAGVGLKNYGSMLFVLPDEGVSTSDILSSSATLEEILAGGKGSGYGRVTFKIPKFGFASSLELTSMLRSLGVESAFGEGADFSLICDNEDMSLSSVAQQTHIAIDERGVEASAFTKIDYAGAALPEDNADIILDRPFIFIIKSSFGALFMGVVNDPSAE